MVFPDQLGVLYANVLASSRAGPRPAGDPQHVGSSAGPCTTNRGVKGPEDEADQGVKLLWHLDPGDSVRALNFRGSGSVPGSWRVPPAGTRRGFADRADVSSDT